MANTKITTNVIADDAITTAKIADDAVGNDQLASGLTLGGNTAATLSTAAQPNITSVGTLSALTISGNLTVDTTTLKVDSSNNLVGIGTTSPNGNGQLTINSPSNNSPQIVFTENNSAKWLIGHRHDDDRFRFYDLANSAERLTINSSGAVGIGVTSGAWSSNYPALQIGYAATFTGHASNTQTQLGQNWWIGTGNQYVVNGAASRLVMNPDSTIIFSQAPS